MTWHLAHQAQSKAREIPRPPIDTYDDAKHERTIMSAEGVIDWDEAMEQCGDDEEFLRELLADLRGEVDQQVKKIDEMLTNVSGLDSTLSRRK